MMIGMGFFQFVVGGDASYRPHLGDSLDKYPLPASEWWEQVVLVLSERPFSRKQIVLSAANKDGGAHVDKRLDDEYAFLAACNDLGAFLRLDSEDVAFPFSDAHYVSLRQMAWEVINSPDLIALLPPPK